MQKEITFTCAVCPNGCRLAAERGEMGCFFPKETGRCVRGALMIGKEYILTGETLVKLDHPMTKGEVAELVEKAKKDRILSNSV